MNKVKRGRPPGKRSGKTTSIQVPKNIEGLVNLILAELIVQECPSNMVSRSKVIIAIIDRYIRQSFDSYHIATKKINIQEIVDEIKPVMGIFPKRMSVKKKKLAE